MLFYVHFLVLAMINSSDSLVSANHAATALNTGLFLWNVSSADTTFPIAESAGHGVCDIARVNSMADAELLTINDTLLIPAQSPEMDNNSCLVQNETYTATCIFVGPHTYTPVTNDTCVKIAQKFQMSVHALVGAKRRPVRGNVSDQAPWSIVWADRKDSLEGWLIALSSKWASHLTFAR